jgi:hypothetical protein
MIHHREARPPTARRGLSLLEILASVFVLSIGLLGVVAVIPFGGFQLHRATVADRTGSCGRSALSEIRIRELTDPNGWYVLNPKFNILRDPPVLQSPDRILCDRPIVIDPLYFGLNKYSGYYDQMRHFPFTASQGATEAMPRISLASQNGPNQPMSTIRADMLTCAEDDLLYTPVQTNEAQLQRPDAVQYSMGPYAGQTASKRQYSWLMMISPQIGDMQQDPNNNRWYTSMTGVSGFEVSAVTFYRRDLICDPNVAVPAERSVAAVVGPGIAGGDVTLSADDADWLDLEDIDWLLLAGSADLGSPITTAKWYRIAGTTKIEGQGPYTRRVSLIGPDAPEHWRNGGIPVHAVLVEGVSGVYTTTIANTF